MTKQKLQGKKRLEYIWEYYKGRIIVFATLLMITISAGFSHLSSNPKNVWTAYIINAQINGEELNPLLKTFQTEIMKDKEDEYILDSSLTFRVNDLASSSDYDQMGKITALYYSKSLDFMIADQEVISHYCQLDAFVNLYDLLDANELKKLEPYFVYMIDKSGNKKAYGIDLRESKIGRLSSSQLEYPIAGILKNSQNKETTIAFIDYILHEGGRII